MCIVFCGGIFVFFFRLSKLAKNKEFPKRGEFIDKVKFYY